MNTPRYTTIMCGDFTFESHPTAKTTINRLDNIVVFDNFRKDITLDDYLEDIILKDYESYFIPQDYIGDIDTGGDSSRNSEVNF